MVKWGQIFGGSDERDRGRWADQARRLLPAHSSDLPPSAVPAKEVTKVALRLKYHIEQVIPIELDEAKIIKANSPVVTKKVIKTALEAGGSEHKQCVVYCLLVCKRWFKKQAMLELWDSDLHDVRAVACEVIAKRIIEDEEDQEYLMQKVLLERFSIVRNGEETEPANVIERAVDMHALTVIGSSGYQKAIKYLWHGWIVQNDKDAGHFIQYEKRDKVDYWTHFDADRMRTPMYQNGVQIFMSVLYLALYTQCINTVNEDGDLDWVEAVVYIMTVSFYPPFCLKLTPPARIHHRRIQQIFQSRQGILWILECLQRRSLRSPNHLLRHPYARPHSLRQRRQRSPHRTQQTRLPLLRLLSTHVLAPHPPLPRHLPVFRRHACGLESHDARISDLLRPPHRRLCWFPPSIRRSQPNRRKRINLQLHHRSYGQGSPHFSGVRRFR